MGACAPISDSKDIFIDEDAGFAAVNAAPLKALNEMKSHKTGPSQQGHAKNNVKNGNNVVASLKSSYRWR